MFSVLHVQRWGFRNHWVLKEMQNPWNTTYWYLLMVHCFRRSCMCTSFQWVTLIWENMNFQWSRYSPNSGWTETLNWSVLGESKCYFYYTLFLSKFIEFNHTLAKIAEPKSIRIWQNFDNSIAFICSQKKEQILQ